MIEGEGGPSQGAETGGMQVSKGQTETTEQKSEQVQRRHIRIPELMKQPLWRYISNLTFREWESNKEAEFLRAADRGRSELGQGKIDPVATAEFRKQGRPGRKTSERETFYRQIRSQYATALIDSPKRIARQSRSSFGDPEHLSWMERYRSFPLREPRKINQREAEKRELALEVDVTGLLEFLDSRINHKNDNLIRAFLQLEVARGQLAQETDPHNRRTLELEIENRQNSVVREAQEKDRINSWRKILDQLSRGEINEREAEKKVAREMKAIDKLSQRAREPGRDQDEMIADSRATIREIISGREAEKKEAYEQELARLAEDEERELVPDAEIEKLKDLIILQGLSGNEEAAQELKRRIEAGDAEATEQFKALARKFFENSVIHRTRVLDIIDFRTGKRIEESDLDAKTAVWLLHLAGVDTLKIRTVNAGEEVKGANNIDTGNRMGLHLVEEIIDGKKVYTVYYDHHTPKGRQDVSAAHVLYYTLHKLGILEARPETERLIHEIVDINDNGKFPAARYRAGEADNMILGLADYLHPSTLLEILKNKTIAVDQILSRRDIERLDLSFEQKREFEIARESKAKEIAQNQEALAEMAREGLIINAGSHRVAIDLMVPDRKKELVGDRWTAIKSPGYDCDTLIRFTPRGIRGRRPQFFVSFAEAIPDEVVIDIRKRQPDTVLVRRNMLMLPAGGKTDLRITLSEIMYLLLGRENLTEEAQGLLNRQLRSERSSVRRGK